MSGTITGTPITIAELVARIIPGLGASAVTSVAGRTGAVSLSPSDVSGLATSATTDATNANNITAGTLAVGRIPTGAAITWSGAQTFGADGGFTSTGFFRLPAGTTAQRPGSPAAGYVRYNSTLADVEHYIGGAWHSWLRVAGGSLTGALTITGGDITSNPPLVIGNGVGWAPGTQIALTNTFSGTGNGHGFSDAAAINLTGTNASYNSFDCEPVISSLGTAGHYAGFQCRPTFTGAGAADEARLHHALLTMTGGGSLAAAYAYLAVAPILTNGSTITDYYGLRVENAGNVTGITNKWGVYVVGDPCYFGDHVGIGITPSARLDLGGNFSAPAWGLNGIMFSLSPSTVTDTTSSGTVASATVTSFAATTIAASSPTTFTEMATVFIGLPPTEGANVTGTNRYSLTVSGDVRFGARLGVGGANAHPASVLSVMVNQSAASWTTTGLMFGVGGQTLTDTTGSGTIATPRTASSFGQPTFASSSAVTLTYGTTVYIEGAPIAGTNTTITNRHSLWVQDGNVYFADFVGVGAVAPTSRIHTSGALSAPAWGTSGLNFFAGPATYTDTTSSGTVASVAANAFATPTFATSSATTFTEAINLFVAAPAAGSNVTITNATALYVSGRAKFVGYVGFGGANANPTSVVSIMVNQSATSWTTTGLLFGVGGQTLTDTSGSGTIAARAASSFGTPTFASSSAVTITNAANLYIAGAPAAGTNTTITNAWAVYVAAGNAFVAGTLVANKWALSATGPTHSFGTGVPATTEPKGSLFSRTDGAVGTTLYVSQGGGTWNAVAGV